MVQRKEEKSSAAAPAISFAVPPTASSSRHMENLSIAYGVSSSLDITASFFIKDLFYRRPFVRELALRCLLYDQVRGARRGKENTKLVAPPIHKRETKTHTSERGRKRRKKREKEKEKRKREKIVKEKRRSKSKFIHSGCNELALRRLLKPVTFAFSPFRLPAAGESNRWIR